MINEVVLVGRLTKDPFKKTVNGVSVTTFTLAVNRPFSNQNGGQDADFINCEVWRGQADNAAKYLRKGSMAGVVGRIQTRSFDGQDGKRQYVTEVVAEKVRFLDGKNNNPNNNNPNNQNTGNEHFEEQQYYGNQDPGIDEFLNGK